MVKYSSCTLFLPFPFFPSHPPSHSLSLPPSLPVFLPFPLPIYPPPPPPLPSPFPFLTSLHLSPPSLPVCCVPFSSLGLWGVREMWSFMVPWYRQELCVICGTDTVFSLTGFHQTEAQDITQPGHRQVAILWRMDGWVDRWMEDGWKVDEWMDWMDGWWVLWLKRWFFWKTTPGPMLESLH